MKAPNLIKGIRLEGLRKIGDPNDYAKRYYADGVDELLFMDIVASLYGRNSLLDIIERTTRDVFVPIIVGGGLRSVGDVRAALQAGADKIAINTAAIKRPELITELAQVFGTQCVVISIEAKSQPSGWEAYTDNGRERTGQDAIEWAKQAAARGAGELLVTSVDREGTRSGFDLELIRLVSLAVPIPVIASGGLGTTDHLVEAASYGLADAVAIADALHYNRIPLPELRRAALARGVDLRPAV